jgi:SAM-dependent methyltransferase
MSFYTDSMYPALVERLGNPGPIQVLRREIVPRADGTVLEIGVGSGLNFPYYDRSKVSKLFALEPNPGMRRREEQQRRTGLDVEFLPLPGERIPLDDATVDTVVSTFTLCSIGPLREALSGLARVLRPGGTLLFLENSIAPDNRVRRWQRWWEPVHHRVFAGLFLTRDIPSMVAGAGLRIERVELAAGESRPGSECCAASVRRLAQRTHTSADHCHDRRRAARRNPAPSIVGVIRATGWTNARNGCRLNLRTAFSLAIALRTYHRSLG